jgi:hypothetical protein
MKMIVELAALVPMQAQFADQLLVSGQPLGLTRDVAEDGGVRRHDG